ncbi:MAG: glycosyltransferase [Deltaproteobacteria bacterium]|nr:glycosyltransferase [Deltaproteobacteria bacterium]
MIRCDLHVHSKFSAKPGNWLARRFNLPESCSEPEKIYSKARERGMTHVTLTDHNEIRGCQELLAYPNTFLSSEITARFPEDQCKIHILVYNINERQYAEIMKIRRDIFDLAVFLNNESIYHAVAHPLYSINDRLNEGIFEKLLVLFDLFEINGSKSHDVNDRLASIVRGLTREYLERLSDKHGLEGKTDPFKKGLVAGSDDHAGVFVAETFTENHNESLDDLFQKHHDNICRGGNSNPHRLAYSIYSVGYQHLQGKFNLERYNGRDSAVRLVDNLLTGKENNSSPGILSSLLGMIHGRTRSYRTGEASLESALARAVDRLSDMVASSQHLDESSRWFRLASSAVNESSRDLLDYTFNELLRGNIFNLFRGIGSLSSLYVLLAPYFISYYIFQETRSFALRVCLEPPPPRLDGNAKVAHFTDTFYDVSGVVTTLHKMAQCSRKHRKDLTFIACADHQSIFGEKVFKPLRSYDLPEYPELKLNWPPLLEVIDYCYHENFTHYHSATPGPMGLVALFMAKIFKKPLYSTYHTAFPQYVGSLIDSSFFEDMTWQYLIWYYKKTDAILVPSQYFIDELIEKGIDGQRIFLMPRGIDTEWFSPGELKPICNGDFNILYVGRISKEKNLSILAEAFKILNADNATLTIVGDGPFREELQRLLEGSRAVFKGFLAGEELLQSYREADIFVFPSTTDTFGNVVLEAQSCGKPVIVTDKGGSKENIIDGKTGIIVRGGDACALADCLSSLLDHSILFEMGRCAREYAEQRNFDSAFLKTWDFYHTQLGSSQSN